MLSIFRRALPSTVLARPVGAAGGSAPAWLVTPPVLLTTWSHKSAASAKERKKQQLAEEAARKRKKAALAAAALRKPVVVVAAPSKKVSSQQSRDQHDTDLKKQHKPTSATVSFQSKSVATTKKGGESASSAKPPASGSGSKSSTTSAKTTSKGNNTGSTGVAKTAGEAAPSPPPPPAVKKIASPPALPPLPEKEETKKTAFLKDEEPVLFSELDAGSPRTKAVDVETLRCDSPAIVGWKCTDCGTQWERSVIERAFDEEHSDCPKCADAAFEPLATRFVKELHPLMNDPFVLGSPISATCASIMLWQCSTCQTQWRCRVRERSLHTPAGNCPGCALSKAEDIVARHHTPAAAGSSRPPSSSTNADSAISSPAAEGTTTTSESRGTTLADEWHPIKNGDASLTAAVTDMGERYWWICQECATEYQASVRERQKGVGCMNEECSTYPAQVQRPTEEAGKKAKRQ